MRLHANTKFNAKKIFSRTILSQQIQRNTLNWFVIITVVCPFSSKSITSALWNTNYLHVQHFIINWFSFFIKAHCSANTTDCKPDEALNSTTDDIIVMEPICHLTSESSGAGGGTSNGNDATNSRNKTIEQLPTHTCYKDAIIRKVIKHFFVQNKKT